ncbi:transposase [Acidaminococcus sp.]|uniref:transposase n=1 Tax=Acidaminococcus sp. TaxID=1872103 RepID=UPI0039BF6987
MLAIDIGLENLATCITRTGTAFIIDGYKLKSSNQYWNKKKVYNQSIADKQGQKKTHRLHALVRKRNRRIQDYIRRVARYIINYCIEHHIGTIVCGCNGDFKHSMNLGKMIKQQFMQISFGSLRETLEGFCKRYGMTHIKQEKFSTSKASCWDLDTIPVCQSGPTVYLSFQQKTNPS